MTPNAGLGLQQFTSLSLQQSNDSIRPSSRDSNCSDTSMTSESNFTSMPAYHEPQRPTPFDLRKRNGSPGSPYGRGSPRPHSGTNTLSAPPMARTRSLPSVPFRRTYSPSPGTSPLRQASPTRSPAMPPRASPRASFELMPSSSTSFMDIVSIAEDAELDFTPRPPMHAQPGREISGSPASLAPYLANTMKSSSNSLSRSNSFGRRRPASPLSQSYHAPPSSTSSSSNSDAFIPSGPASPSTPPLSRSSSSRNYNESYPGFLSTNSSMPSTPLSLRSRSPSVTSLETIPDTPDAEEAATEAFEIARLKAAADAADADADAAAVDEEEEGDGRGQMGGRSGWWTMRDKSRKRWSVSGAERRGDFEMETIWED